MTDVASEFNTKLGRCYFEDINGKELAEIDV